MNWRLGLKGLLFTQFSMLMKYPFQKNGTLINADKKTRMNADPKVVQQKNIIWQIILKMGYYEKQG